jgi:hypothetical protein
MLRAMLMCAVALAAEPDIKDRYLALTSGWAEGVQFTAAERAAMEHGRQYEKEMMEGLDDPLAKRVLALGEPSWETVARFYPAKLLDRTVLGGFGAGGHDEFAVWWNCAIAADIVRRKMPATTITVAYNTNIVFRIGERAEMFGLHRDGYSGLGYEDGHLPIIRARYVRDGIAYDVTMAHGAPDVAHVRMEIGNTTQTARDAWLHEEIVLMAGRADQPSRYISHDDRDARWDGAASRITHRMRLGPGQRRSIHLKVPYLPAPTTTSRADFERAHATARRQWTELLAKGTRIDVPEPRNNNMWRALLLQNFVLADGPRFTYGSGLMYNDSYYPHENGFGTHVFAMYGHKEYAVGLLPMAFDVSIDKATAGRKYQNRRAMPMHHMLALWRLTGDTSAYHRYRADLHRIADEIIAERRSTMALVNGRRPLHWGWLPPDKPGVDLRASTQEVYCPAHNITNCQGLQDLGEFLLATRIDPERGRRYIDEAAAFRQDILRSMEASAIRIPGRPPFVDMQTLYFRDTPDYGPAPYDHIALGRLQGAYHQYWVDMQLQFQFFNPDTEVGNWLVDYVQERGGKVMGLTRARMRPGDLTGWVNTVYNHGFHNYRLRQGRVDEFLLGFYGRLALAHSRNTQVASEGQPLIGYNTRDGGLVAADLSFPNSAANSETLSMLRAMLLHEDLVENRPTGTLHLLRGVPSAWLRPGRRIDVERAPTMFGDISFTATGETGAVRVRLRGPHPDLSIRGTRVAAGRDTVALVRLQ